MNKNQELFGSSNNYLYLCKTQTAEIAQLVEHDLAKVGVAGPSPVFRSFQSFSTQAAMVELVDTRDLKSLGQ